MTKQRRKWKLLTILIILSDMKLGNLLRSGRRQRAGVQHEAGVAATTPRDASLFLTGLACPL